MCVWKHLDVDLFPPSKRDRIIFCTCKLSDIDILIFSDHFLLKRELLRFFLVHRCPKMLAHVLYFIMGVSTFRGIYHFYFSCFELSTVLLLCLKDYDLPVFPWAVIYQPLLSVFLLFLFQKLRQVCIFLKPKLVFFIPLSQSCVTKISTFPPPISSHISYFSSLWSPVLFSSFLLSSN